MTEWIANFGNNVSRETYLSPNTAGSPIVRRKTCINTSIYAGWNGSSRTESLGICIMVRGRRKRRRRSFASFRRLFTILSRSYGRVFTKWVVRSNENDKINGPCWSPVGAFLSKRREEKQRKEGEILWLSPDNGFRGAKPSSNYKVTNTRYPY